VVHITIGRGRVEVRGQGGQLPRRIDRDEGRPPREQRQQFERAGDREVVVVVVEAAAGVEHPAPPARPAEHHPRVDQFHALVRGGDPLEDLRLVALRARYSA
jgi:hypothetical protein